MKKMNQLLVFLLGIGISMPFSVISQTVETFTSSGSWVCPSGVTSIKVECWGGGGAGGGSRAVVNSAGGGGGGGGYSMTPNVAVTPGNSYDFIVGVGGTGVSNAAGNAGTATSFNITIVVANGGGGGGRGNSGSAGAGATLGTGSTKYIGGNGAAGVSGTGSGASGGGAGSSGNGGNAAGQTGGIATATNGGPGVNGRTTTNAGLTGIVYGGGGSGSYTTAATANIGGDGAPGLVKISYTCTPAPTSVDGSGITNVSCGTINNTSGTETNNYGDYSAQSTFISQGATASVNITYSTGYTYDTKIWVDWNNDSDFDDAGEEVYTGTSLGDNPTTLAASFTVPIGASLGNHRMRIGGQDNGPCTPCYTGTYGTYEDYTLTVTAAVAMTYSSCTTTQTNVSSVAPGSTSQEIIGMQVVTSGVTSPLTASSFTFNTSGSTSAANIANAKLWTSGTSSTFATTTQLGSATVSPSGSFTITGGSNMPYTLSSGTNYFWLTYDIVASPVMGNVVDATCTSITVGSARTPSVTVPTGSRTIALAYCNPAPTSLDGSGITNVSCGTINNTTGTETNNYGDYSAQSTSISQGASASVNITYTTGFTYDTKIWVDWNVDGDFDDAGEEVFSGTSGSASPTTLAASFTVPIGASLGNHRMRIGGQDDGPCTPCYTGTYGTYEDYTLTVTAAVAMTYSSCTTTQTNVSSVAPGSTSQEIIGMQIVTSGVTTPLTASSFTFNITGSSAAANIANAKLWTSGTSSAFATTTQLGSATVSPTGSFTISGGTNMPYTLSSGTNYFWLTYDIVASPILNDVVDATCTSITVGSARTPTETAPTGARTIALNYCSPTYSSGGSNDKLTHVVLETLDDTPPTNNSPYYFNRTAAQSQIPTLNNSNTHTLTLMVGSDNNQYTRVWVDFNQNGTFEASESFSTGTNAGSDGTVNISIVVPAGALAGQTLMRIRGGEDVAITDAQACGASSSSYGQALDYYVNITPAVNMSYVSCTSTQLNTNVISAGTTNQEIICMKVITSGSLNPLSVTEFRMRTDGTTAYSTDIRNAKVWHTGNSSTFSTSNQLGSTVATPPSSATDMVFTGTQTLSPGTNYFWMTYDVPSSAVNGNFADAKFQSVVVASVTRTPTVSTPAEQREIIRGCFYTLTLEDDACDGWNGAKITVKVNGTPRLTDVSFSSGCAAAFQFIAETGQSISTEYTAGSYSTENSYYITNPNGAYVTSSGEAQTAPVNKSATSDCNAVKQFTTNVNSYQSGTSCFIITEDKTSQKGSIWSNYKIDMSESFTIEFDLFLGDDDGGADGVVFALQGSCTSAGGNGSSIGFGGINNSLGVEFDTYDNGSNGDLASDHVAIISNGSSDHGAASNLRGPFGVANMEDNAWHPVKITWNATSKKFSVAYGTLSTDTLSYTGDIVTNLFAGNSQVFWGFTGATGASSNLQKVCVTSYPQNTMQVSDTTIDIGNSVAVQVASGATNYTWIPDDGSVSNTTIANPVLSPAVTTEYTCLLEDGCGNIITNKFVVRINSVLPVELIELTSTCENGHTTLYWTTASETNNLGFEIAKSSDAIDYSTIGFVTGAGNSNNFVRYSFFDAKENSEIAYYRVTQKDINNRFSESYVIPVQCQAENNSISLTPNPCNDHVTISVAYPLTEKVSILFFDATSQLVLQKQFPSLGKSININTSYLAPGIYYVRIVSDLEIKSIKLIKM